MTRWIALVACTALIACGTDDAPSGPVQVSVDGHPLEVVTGTVTMTAHDTDARLVVKAQAASDGTVTATLDLDPDVLPDLVVGYPYRIDAVTTAGSGGNIFAAQPAQPAFIRWVSASSDCDACALAIPADQWLSGALEISAVSARRLDGRVTIEITREPSDGTAVTVEATFSVSIPEIEAEPAPRPPTEHPKVKEAPYDGPSVTLSANTSVCFDVAERHSPLSTADDMNATPAGNHLKLTPGGPLPTKSNPVNWFMAGGKPKLFESLADVPATLPVDQPGLPLIKPKPGMAFVVKNNTSPGYTRGFVAQAVTEALVLHYELMP